MSKVLYETIDYLVAHTQLVAFRDQPRLVKRGIALLDRHQLWKPRGKDAIHASNAIVQAFAELIFNLFGDVNETRLFRMAERQCGEQCARVVEAFGLQRHRKVKEFWTYSKYGLAKPIDD